MESRWKGENPFGYVSKAEFITPKRKCDKFLMLRIFIAKFGYFSNSSFFLIKFSIIYTLFSISFFMHILNCLQFISFSWFFSFLVKCSNLLQYCHIINKMHFDQQQKNWIFSLNKQLQMAKFLQSWRMIISCYYVDCVVWAYQRTTSLT